jgi:tetratricopeptide (TPR) repeat protein
MYKLDPTSWHVHRLQAQLYEAQGRHEDAIDEYLQAIHAQPGNADLYESLGEEYRKTGRLDLAQNAYQKELQLSPRNGVAMYNLGSIDVERDDAKDGVPLLEDVVKFYAGAPVAKYYLGRGLAALDRNDEATRYLTETVKEDPSSEIAKRSYYELSRIYRKEKKTTEAQNALTQYVRLKAQLEKRSAPQVEDWKRLTTASQSATTSPAASPGP